MEYRANWSKSHGESRLEAISIVCERTGKIDRVPASAVFIFIGAEPRTEWLDGVIERDARGFILTGADLMPDGKRPKGWTLDRDPGLLETNVPGMFAVGDVRHGSVKRVASGVGEGSIAIQFVHQYLSEGILNGEFTGGSRFPDSDERPSRIRIAPGGGLRRLEDPNWPGSQRMPRIAPRAGRDSLRGGLTGGRAFRNPGWRNPDAPRERGTGFTDIFRPCRPGTGMLPFSRMTSFPLMSRALAPTRIARLHADLFPEMLERIPKLLPAPGERAWRTAFARAAARTSSAKSWRRWASCPPAWRTN